MEKQGTSLENNGGRDDVESDKIEVDTGRLFKKTVYLTPKFSFLTLDLESYHSPKQMIKSLKTCQD